MNNTRKPIPDYVKRNREYVLLAAQDSERRGELEQALENYRLLVRIAPGDKSIRNKVNELTARIGKPAPTPTSNAMPQSGPVIPEIKAQAKTGLRTFLIQTNGEVADCHGCWNHSDRTFAEELYIYGYYLYEYWDCANWGLGIKHRKRTDLDFGKVRVGDQVTQYSTSNVHRYPSQIKFLYRVLALEHVPQDIIDKAVKEEEVTASEAKWIAKKPRLIRLEKVYELKNPPKLGEIMSLVGKRTLSKNVGNCSTQGFNICEVMNSDFDYLLMR